MPLGQPFVDYLGKMNRNDQPVPTGLFLILSRFVKVACRDIDIKPLYRLKHDSLVPLNCQL
jgi:hypothetical protein